MKTRVMFKKFIEYQELLILKNLGLKPGFSGS
jgi:hypothetical protein